MAYTIPPEFRYPIDLERLQNIYRYYPYGYKPVKRYVPGSSLNINLDDIQGEENIPYYTLPAEVQDYIASSPGVISQQYVPQGRDMTSEITGKEHMAPVEWSEESRSRFVPPKSDGDKSGGKFDLSAISGAASTAMGMVGDIFSSSKSQFAAPAHTKYYEDRIGNLTDLYGMNRRQYINKDLANKPTGAEIGIDIGSKTLQGAMAGTSISPGWGTLIGAAAGAVLGGVNTAVKYDRYKRDLSSIKNFNRQEQINRDIAYTTGLNNVRTNRNTMMNRQRIFNYYGLGGSVEPSELMGVTQFNAGGTHEGNPNGGVPIGVGENGQPNLVEEGEVRWDDFIFSKRVKPTEATLKKYNTFMKGGYESYADLANRILELHKEREDSPYDKATMKVQMQRLADAQEWEKLSEEAAENGMTPEEYVEYQQYMQAQGNQFALGGNVFANGGEPKYRKSDGMPRHGATTKDYYDAHKGDSAWYIEKFLDAMYANPTADTPAQGFMLDKNGNFIKYKMSDYDKYRTNVARILTQDPEAVYYMYNRIKEIENSKFGGDTGLVTDPITGQRVYDFGRIMNVLGNPNVKYKDKYLVKSTQTPVYSYDPIGTNTVQIAPQFVATEQDAIPDIIRNEIEAEIANYNATPLSGTSVTKNKRQSAQGSGVGYGIGYGSKYPSANNYQGDEWTNFLNYRDNVPGAIEDFAKQYNINLSPATILKNLKDNKRGPITNSFIEYANGRAKVSATPETTAQEPVQDNGEEQPAVTEKAAPATNTETDTTDNNGQTPYNRLGFSPYDALRLAPVFSSLRSVLEQQGPDYTYANQIASLYRPQTYRPTGQYMRYMPVDQHYIDTMANQQRNTMYGIYRQNAMSPAVANYYATLAANNAGSQASKAYREAVLQNNQNRNMALQYNNQLDAYNEGNSRQVADINYRNWMNIMAQSYAAAEQERLAVEQAREANRQNLAANIGLVGRELSDRYYVAKNPALIYGPMGAYYKYLTGKQ